MIFRVPVLIALLVFAIYLSDWWFGGSVLVLIVHKLIRFTKRIFCDSQAVVCVMY